MHLLSLFFAIFILAGVTMAGFGIHNIVQAHESRNWLSTDGSITFSDIERRSGSKGGSSYAPSVRYQYTIQGKQYEGSMVAIGLKHVSAGRSFAERIIKKYPQGKSLQVFYNPADPSESVLEPGLSKRSFILFSAGITFALIGSCFALVTWLFSP